MGGVEEVKEDPNLHLGEVLQTLGNNKVDPIDPNKLHGVDPKVVVTDMVGQIWAVGIKDPLKICPGITMVVAAVVADRVVESRRRIRKHEPKTRWFWKQSRLPRKSKLGWIPLSFVFFGTYCLDIVLKLLLLMHTCTYNFTHF